MFYTGVGILRLGWVTKFLSHAVIGGFTTGAAITIAMGQVGVELSEHIWGQHLQSEGYQHTSFRKYINLDTTAQTI